MTDSKSDIQMLPPKHVLHSKRVLLKDFLIKKGLKALLVEENFLFDDEGRCLMRAFQAMGALEFEWCKTDDLFNGTKVVDTHSCECNYDAFEVDYLQYEDGIQYWDRLMYLANAPVYVMHTAYAQTIYAGPADFISAIDVIEKPTVIDEWLQVVGSYYTDPELKKEYGLSKLQSKK